MSYVLTCPNCGPREVTDFAFGGELNPRPKSAPSLRELGEYNYFRRNVAGVQQEWWLHRSGCGEWFIAERNTLTNEVHWTAPPTKVFGEGGMAAVDTAGGRTAADAAGAAAGGGSGAAAGGDGSGVAGSHGV
jgi:heterotetrameric sarcosine oxidase delta subunit